MCKQSLAFIKAVLAGNRDLVQRFIDTRIDLNAKCGSLKATALQYAIYSGQEAIVHLLLEHNASVAGYSAKYGWAALQSAVFYGTPALVRLLQSAGADFNDSLFEAAYFDYLENISPKNIDIVDSIGANLAHYAAINGQVTTLQWLQAKGISLIEKTTIDNNTPLLFAASNGHTQAVSWLLENGASLAEKNQACDTALLRAATGGHIETMAWLLNNGANLAEHDRYGNNALLCAAANGHTEAMAWLLANGASLEKSNEYGATALLQAACNGHPNTVAWLLAHGANINEKTLAGTTALVGAAVNGHIKTAVLLLEHGADLTIKSTQTDRMLLFEARGMRQLIADDEPEPEPEPTFISPSIRAAYAAGVVAAQVSMGGLPLGLFAGGVTAYQLLIFYDAAAYKLSSFFGNTERTVLQLAVDNQQWLFAEYLVLFYNSNFTEKHITSVLQQLHDDGAYEVISIPLLSKYAKKSYPTLRLTGSTLTISAEVITSRQWLEIMSLLKYCSAIPTLVINESRLELDVNTPDTIRPIFGLNSSLITLHCSHVTFAPDALAWFVRIWQCTFEDLTNLQLTHCLLADGDILQLEPIFYLQNLVTLNLSSNVLGYIGVIELLHHARTAAVERLILANNFIYANLDESTRLNTKLCQTSILHCDVSMNYFLQSTKDTFFRRSDISASLDSRCLETTSNSLLIDDENNRVGRNVWNIFLLRNGNSQDGAHVRILVEGVRGFGQRFLTQYDFRPTGSSFFGLGTVIGKVDSRDFSPDRLFSDVNALHFKAYSVDRLTAKKLICFMKADKDKTLYYHVSGGKRSGKCSTGQTYNCFTWAIAKLIEAGIVGRDQIPNLVPYPPYYLSGRHAAERNILSECRKS